MDARKLAAAWKYLLPAAIAAGMPGDDDAALLLLQTLLSLALYCLMKQLLLISGLAIMEEAGLKATPRQRARLAGAWTSYLLRSTCCIVGW